MNTQRNSPGVLAVVCSLTVFSAMASGRPVDHDSTLALYAGFADPAPEYGPRTWWHWLNENVTTYGITKDLEAMKTMGYKGAHVVNLPQGGPAWTFGDDVIGSPVWMDKVEHAAKECERLGLELSIGSCAGWVAGGPWITPELSMQEIVWRHTYVNGPISGTLQLPQPTTNRGYYRDIAVLAYPSLPGEAQPLASLRPKISSDLANIDWAAATDGDPDTFVDLPRWEKGEKSRCVVFEFEEPVTVRSLSVQMQEDSKRRELKLFSSEDARQWHNLVVTHRWRNHFDPGREEMVDGFEEKQTRFVKLEIPAAAPPGVGMKLYELNFLSARLNSLHTKAGRQRTRPTISNPTKQTIARDQQIPVGQILDLTDALRPDGTLNCKLPSGAWTILRFGHTSNGNEIGPASERAGGLESDKFSAEALTFHMDEGIVKSTFERLGDLTGTVLVEMGIDSWEANCQTWTKTFPEEFQTRRGYEMRKWLPTLTGRFVGSVDETERFLWDYRRTIGDLLADNFYGAFGDYIREYGLKLCAEAPGIGMPIQCDQIQVQGLMDIPQGEFWLGGTPNPKFPQWPGGQDNTKEAAAAGHVYGKEVISCEAFTSFAHHDGYTQYPHILKPVGDRQFCKGMNEMVFHRYAHQPTDRVPGMGLGQFGLNLERTTTWWEPGREWITYLRRCQYMLRQGRFVADVCYYYGEDVPGSAYYFTPNALDPRKQMKPVLPKGYDYDVCDRITFDRLTVENGEVVLPSGMRYRYLVLPDHARYTPAALEKVLELVEAGATAIGPKPSRCPSLAGYPSADNTIQQMAAKLWPEGAGERKVGKGRVIAGKSFAEILAADTLVPDFQSGADHVRYIHRKLAAGDSYFVSYQEDQAKDLTLTFRVTGRVPELWNPVTGKKTVVANYIDNGTDTTIPLKMDPYGSRFVIFRPAAVNNAVVKLTKDGLPVCLDGNGLFYTVWENGSYAAEFSNGAKADAAVKDIPASETMPGEWSVTFQKERGAPAGVIAFNTLQSWTDRPEEGIKYFSGTATYQKTINVSADRLNNGRHIHLDLGDVRHLAEVFVNDQPLGVLWKPPFRVDITDAATNGANKVEVKVTNCWKNRILGDWKLPEDQRITWTLYPFYHDEKDAPLMESGLLGPVRLLSSESVLLTPREQCRQWVPAEIGEGTFRLKPDKVLNYKTVDKKGEPTELNLQLFLPEGHQPSDRRPAIVFFHGGGWYGGTADHMYPQCRYLALRGMVAISVEYRTIKAFGTTPQECVKDGKSAMRWVRTHAAELGIDFSTLLSGGGSAGGHIAAATALVEAFNEAEEDSSVSCRPQALVLFNPVFDNGPGGFAYELVREYWKAISPIDHIDANTPPTFIILGTKDEYIPAETGQRFERLMKENGRRCDLHLYEGKEHGFFNLWVDRNLLAETMIRMDRFLSSLGYLEGEPTLKLNPPEGEALSTEYTVEVNGQEVPVFTSAVSPDAQQAPLNLNELYSFSGFECSAPVEVTIRSSEPLTDLSVRSVRQDVPVVLEGCSATFTLENNGNYLIERNGNGRKDPLLLFANPVSDRPDQSDPNVRWFGPGRHNAGLISLSDNQTLYIDREAVVTGRVEARGDNIRICGTGVLENSGEAYNWKHMILLEGCTRTRVEGVVLRKHSRGWTVKAVGCEDMNISNMKIVGSHSYNDDGIDLCNSRNVKIDGCFIRTNDDCFAFKGMDDESRTNCENILVTDCMMWSDLCCTILLGDESRADFMRNIVFRDCFVPFLSYEKYLKQFLMLHACEEMRLENVLVANVEIRGEGQNRNYIEMACEFNQWCKTETAGYIKDIVLRNVQLTGKEGGYQVVIKGFDETHTVEDVRFENCTINGRPITAGAPNVTVGDFTKTITFQEEQ